MSPNLIRRDKEKWFKSSPKEFKNMPTEEQKIHDPHISYVDPGSGTRPVPHHTQESNRIDVINFLYTTTRMSFISPSTTPNDWFL